MADGDVYIVGDCLLPILVLLTSAIRPDYREETYMAAWIEDTPLLPRPAPHAIRVARLHNTLELRSSTVRAGFLLLLADEHARWSLGRCRGRLIGL